MTMMKVLAVKQVGQSAEGHEKPWTRQKVRLEDPGNDKGFVDGQLFCNKFTPVPKEGDELDVKQIKQPDNPAWLPEIELNRKGGFGGGGFQGPRPEDPKRMASIAMQHSQDTALRMVTWALENGLVKDQTIDFRWFQMAIADNAQLLYAQVKGAQDA
jgi:hypothetical protein